MKRNMAMEIRGGDHHHHHHHHQRRRSSSSPSSSSSSWAWASTLAMAMAMPGAEEEASWMMQQIAMKPLEGAEMIRAEGPGATDCRYDPCPEGSVGGSMAAESEAADIRLAHRILYENGGRMPEDPSGTTESPGSRRRNRSRSMSYHELPDGTKEALKAYCRSHAPPCNMCGSSARVKFRFFNNPNNLSRMLQSRFRCANPACLRPRKSKKQKQKQRQSNPATDPLPVHHQDTGPAEVAMVDQVKKKKKKSSSDNGNQMVPQQLRPNTFTVYLSDLLQLYPQSYPPIPSAHGDPPHPLVPNPQILPSTSHGIVNNSSNLAHQHVNPLISGANPLITSGANPIISGANPLITSGANPIISGANPIITSGDSVTSQVMSQLTTATAHGGGAYHVIGYEARSRGPMACSTIHELSIPSSSSSHQGFITCGGMANHDHHLCSPCPHGSGPQPDVQTLQYAQPSSPFLLKAQRLPWTNVSEATPLSNMLYVDMQSSQYTDTVDDSPHPVFAMAGDMNPISQYHVNDDTDPNSRIDDTMGLSRSPGFLGRGLAPQTIDNITAELSFDNADTLLQSSSTSASGLRSTSCLLELVHCMDLESHGGDIDNLPDLSHEFKEDDIDDIDHDNASTRPHVNSDIPLRHLQGNVTVDTIEPSKFENGDQMKHKTKTKLRTSSYSIEVLHEINRHPSIKLSTRNVRRTCTPKVIRNPNCPLELKSNPKHAHHSQECRHEQKLFCTSCAPALVGDDHDYSKTLAEYDIPGPVCIVENSFT